MRYRTICGLYSSLCFLGHSYATWLNASKLRLHNWVTWNIASKMRRDVNGARRCVLTICRHCFVPKKCYSTPRNIPNLNWNISKRSIWNYDSMVWKRSPELRKKHRRDVKFYGWGMKKPYLCCARFYTLVGPSLKYSTRFNWFKSNNFFLTFPVKWDQVALNHFCNSNTVRELCLKYMLSRALPASASEPLSSYTSPWPVPLYTHIRVYTVQNSIN